MRSNRKSEKAKDGGWGWIVVLGSCICHFFLIGINRSMGIVYLLLQEQFDATGRETALAASIFVSIRALGGPLASKLTDSFGCRAVTMTGGVLLCVGFLLSTMAINIINVYVTFGVIAGIGGVLVFTPSYIAVSQWFDEKKGKAMSFSTLGTGFGSIVMAPMLMALVSHYGYSGTMLITGALMLNNSVGGALYRRPPKKSRIREASFVEVKTGKSDGKLNSNTNENLVVAIDKCVMSENERKMRENATELTVSPDKMMSEKVTELNGVQVQETNQIAQKCKDNTKSAEREKSSEIAVILDEKSLESGAVFHKKSSESDVNSIENTSEELVEMDLHANGVMSLENSGNADLMKSPEPDEQPTPTESTEKAAHDYSGDMGKLGDPIPSNGWADNLHPPVIISATVDTKVTSPGTQLASILESSVYNTIMKDAVNNLVENRVVERRRCLACCPSLHGKLSYFKSSLWCNVPFILYCALVTTTQACIHMVLIFLPGCGRELGGTRQQASLLLTVFGVADMVGRIVFGFIFDLKPLLSRRTDLYTAVAASFAAMAILLGFMPSFMSLAVVTTLVGFFEGAAHSQRATNVTELVEPSQMSIGVGLVLFFQGVGNFYGPLVGGALKDRTGSFSNGFIFGGTTLLCVCLLTVLCNAVRNQDKKRKNHKAAVVADQIPC